MSKKAINYKFRDVSDGIRKFREILLGRNYDVPRKNSRYNPLLSPRSVPQPDIPRGPEYKYSNQYYFRRTALDSVHPPIVAPVALGLEQKQSGILKAIAEKKTATVINFPRLPTPGYAYWWDAHCYYECIRDMPKAPPTPKTPPPPPRPVCPPPHKPEPIPKSPCDPCDPQNKC